MTLFGKFQELMVILPVISSNLPQPLPNNPKNAPQRLLKMLSSDKHLLILLYKIPRISQKPATVRTRLCTLRLSLLTQPLSPSQSPPESTIRRLSLNPYLYPRHGRSPQLQSLQSPSYRRPSQDPLPRNFPNPYHPLSSSPKKTQSTRSCMLNTIMHSWK